VRAVPEFTVIIATAAQWNQRSRAFAINSAFGSTKEQKRRGASGPRAAPALTAHQSRNQINARALIDRGCARVAVPHIKELFADQRFGYRKVLFKPRFSAFRVSTSASAAAMRSSCSDMIARSSCLVG
jgi:hypothetical protein